MSCSFAGAGRMGVVGVATAAGPMAKRWPATHDRLGKEVGKVTDGAAQTQCMRCKTVL